MKVSQFKEISSMYLNKMKKPVIRNGVLFIYFILCIHLCIKVDCQNL